MEIIGKTRLETKEEIVNNMQETKEKENRSGAFRNKKVYFTQVSNVPLRSKDLSLKAKGLYAMIQSYITIEGFTLYKNMLMANCQEGESSFNKTWKELKDKGYLVQYKMQDKKGNFYYEYELLDIVDEIKQDVNFNKKDDKIDESIGNATKCPPPQKPHPGLSTGGKVGVYNNTELNNTYCMYVCMLKEKFEKHKLEITNEFENFLINNDIHERMELDTFEAIIVDVLNNKRVKRHIAYLRSTLTKLMNVGVRTLEDYNKHLESFSKSYNTNTRNNKQNGYKGQNNNSQTYNRGAGFGVKNNFKDFTPDELEKILLESQKGKFN